MTNATTTAAAPPGNPGHGRRRWLSRRSRLVPLAAALTICPLALYAIARWDMVGLAFAVLVSGAVAISVGVWSMLGGPDTRRAVVGEVMVDVGVALVTGAALGLVLFAAQDRVEESRFRREQGLEAERAERDERRDNIRLVRELAAYPGTSKHFDGLDLRGAVLEALDLTGASFAGSDLRRARLSGATLTEAQFFSWGDHHEADAGYFDTARLVGGERANLSDATLDDSTLVRAHLVGANLRGASLTFANLTEADLSYADLTGADLSGARLENTILIEGTVLDDVVYDETTVWPEGFTPPS